jgi:hypothetical protein
LLAKAYKRLLAGATKKLHKTTIQRLIDAGYEVFQMTGLMDDDIASNLPLGAFTRLEVS